MSVKVGVAMPVYNGEKTLVAAVESIRRQTLTEWELVIVDDGSIDGTARIADELAAGDPRIRVIHQANGGSYNARNAGLEALTAAYLTSLDADDTIDPDMFRVMHELAVKEHLDLVECDLSIAGKNDGSVELFKGKEEVRRHYIEPVFLEGSGFLCVCGKLYARHLLFEDVRRKDIIEQRCTLFDDVLFNTQVLYIVESYGRIHRAFYNYQISDSSSVRNFNPKCLSGFERAVEMRKKLAPRYGIPENDQRWADWTLKNAFNLVKLAAYANQASWMENVRNVKLILSLKCVKGALGRGTGTSPSSRLATMFWFLSVCPVILVVFVIKAVKWVRR